MGVPDILVFIALAFAAIEQVNARGRSLGMWAVIFICAALLWGSLIADLFE